MWGRLWVPLPAPFFLLPQRCLCLVFGFPTHFNYCISMYIYVFISNTVLPCHGKYPLVIHFFPQHLCFWLLYKLNCEESRSCSFTAIQCSTIWVCQSLFINYFDVGHLNCSSFCHYKQYCNEQAHVWFFWACVQELFLSMCLQMGLLGCSACIASIPSPSRKLFFNVVLTISTPTSSVFKTLLAVCPCEHLILSDF